MKVQRVLRWPHHSLRSISSDGKSVQSNPFSWNTATHLLYVDQPVGTGFSHGSPSSIANTSAAAAVDFYAFLQVLFKDTRFAKYAPNTVGLWTEVRINALSCSCQILAHIYLLRAMVVIMALR